MICERYNFVILAIKRLHQKVNPQCHPEVIIIIGGVLDSSVVRLIC